MPFTVTLRQSFIAAQGLRSPVRERAGLAPLVVKEGFRVTLHVGLRFGDDQLKETGWFVDTDAVQAVVDECCTWLSSGKWTDIFAFRPTFELVARDVFQRLSPDIAQLSHVELENHTVGVSTRYQGS